MTKVICTTTINAPTEALKKFAAMEDWRLVVAGDLKTPSNFESKILGEPGFLVVFLKAKADFHFRLVVKHRND